MKLAGLAQIAFIAVASLGAYSFVRAARHDHRLTSCTALCELAPAYAGRNRSAPDFELPDMTGRAVRLSSFRGKPVVLNFWSVTCKACKEELPSLAELAELGARRGVAVLTVCADDGPAAIEATLREVFGSRPPPLPVLFDPDLEVIGDKYGTTLYPETWLIDADGIIRARFDGKRDWSSGLVLDVVERLATAPGCPVEFARGRPVGPFAGLCPE